MQPGCYLSLQAHAAGSGTRLMLTCLKLGRQLGPALVSHLGPSLSEADQLAWFECQRSPGPAEGVGGAIRAWARALQP
jgi:hypothetical protein